MDNHGKKVWMDGAAVDWADAKVHVMTHTLHYGLGIFEGIRCYKTGRGPAIFRFDEHIDRLYRSAHIMGLEIPYDKEKIKQATKDLIKTNRFEECYIRHLVYLGDGKFGLNYLGSDVRMSIIMWPWGAYLGEDGLEKGIRTRISSYTRHHVNSAMTKAKVCGYYVNSILAKTEALQDGYDEGILLDTAGNVAEGSGENIFIVRDGKLKTPPIATVLEGITRNSIFQIAKSLDIMVVEQLFTRDELYIADEAFFCGTAAEVTPIREVDRRTIGSGSRGPVTKKIQDMFFEIVKGGNGNFADWLSLV